ncbi:MAG TPA: ribonuclease HII [Xanthomonadales bacterium]|nr:ribonuclease HII [Xanthomonadales bacterium]
MNATRDSEHHQWVAGVDEAGRGPLAGPVVVAAVILPARHSLAGLDDSKRLSRVRREVLFDEIRHQATCWAIETVDVEEIDRLNILRATLTGMQRAVLALHPAPGLTLVDGNRAPELACEVRTIIEGDHWVPAISAASILAKVTRDALMQDWHDAYPQYGFDHNKGYPTPEHLECLRKFGPCPIHRRSFAPVRAVLAPSLF